MKPVSTPVVTMMSIVHHNAHPGSKRSWRKLNETLRAVLRMAVRSEMRFEVDDVRDIYDLCNGSFWFGSNDEWFLSDACKVGNASAAASYLSFKGRDRFRVRPLPGISSYNANHYGLDLLCVGREVQMQGDTFEVTSFNDDKGTVTLCSYDAPEMVGPFEPWPRSSHPKRRITCTAKEFWTMHTERRS
jgi:hypothetical protein